MACNSSKFEIICKYLIGEFDFFYTYFLEKANFIWRLKFNHTFLLGFVKFETKKSECWHISFMKRLLPYW